MDLFLVLMAALLATPQTGSAVQPTAPPVPYRMEPFEVTNGAVTLKGTLTVPAGAGPFPAVVLISGSGPQNRDEDIFGFKVFGVLADSLTRQGIAVYRYDDRGVDGSTGNLAASTTADFAGDALAAIARLKAVREIAADRIGLLGHSEGATAAAIAAAMSSDVAFVVMLAGTGVPGDQVLRQQARDIATAQGASPERVERVVAAHRAVTDGLLRGAPSDEQMRALRALVEAQVDAAPAAQQTALGDRSAFVERAAKSALAQMSTPWLKFMVAFDPAPTLRRITVPVYAAFGERDTQVPPSLNEGPVREALRNNTRLTIKVYPEANHLFQRARTGQVAEYMSLDKAFVPGLLDDVARWILGAGR
jgi:pimeloyl-ACP methyl ester carboxylesterase